MRIAKLRESFYLLTPMNLSEEGKWLLAVTSFEGTNSSYNIPDENKTSSITTPARWSSRGGAETMNRLQKLLETISQKYIELQVEEVKKSGNQKKETRNINYLTLILV